MPNEALDTQATQLVDTGSDIFAANGSVESSAVVDTVQSDTAIPAAPAQELTLTQTDNATTELASEAQAPSYGKFLEHTEHTEVTPDAPTLLDPGNTLLGSALSTATWLCVILGCIYLAYWLLRRFGPRGIAKSNGFENPQLVGRLMLGQRQHVDMVRVNKRTFMLGVTDTNINLLTEIEPQPGQCFDDEDEDDFTNFTEMLGKQIDSSDGN